MSAYYNEIDPYAAQWLRNLISAGHIAPGDVDERSIADVKAADLVGYNQCHFFAGIGVWSHALRQAGWPDDRPVWTGSCPCQPFSAAGKGEGIDDARHLWPHWFRLIREHRPVAIFGEQVAASIRHGWLDLVCADLEGAGYAVGAAVLGAHSVGAPHIRQRLYFVADAQGRVGRLPVFARRSRQAGSESERSGEARSMADLHSPRCGEGRSSEAGDGRGAARVESPGLRVADFELGHADNARSQGWRVSGADRSGDGADQCVVREAGTNGEWMDDSAGARQQPAREGTESETRDEARLRGLERGRATNGFWRYAEWLPCIDGKARPVEPGTFPLAHGAAARVGRLRAYGNAICAPQAAEFIKATYGG